MYITILLLSFYALLLNQLMEPIARCNLKWICNNNNLSYILRTVLIVMYRQCGIFFQCLINVQILYNSCKNLIFRTKYKRFHFCIIYTRFLTHLIFISCYIFTFLFYIIYMYIILCPSDVTLNGAPWQGYMYQPLRYAKDRFNGFWWR